LPNGVQIPNVRVMGEKVDNFYSNIGRPNRTGTQEKTKGPGEEKKVREEATSREDIRKGGKG